MKSWLQKVANLDSHHHHISPPASGNEMIQALRSALPCSAEESGATRRGAARWLGAKVPVGGPPTHAPGEFTIITTRQVGEAFSMKQRTFLWFRGGSFGPAKVVDISRSCVNQTAPHHHCCLLHVTTLLVGSCCYRSLFAISSWLVCQFVSKLVIIP